MVHRNSLSHKTPRGTFSNVGLVFLLCSSRVFFFILSNVKINLTRYDTHASISTQTKSQAEQGGDVPSFGRVELEEND